MPYEYGGCQPKLFHPHHSVVDKSGPGHVRRVSVAAAMTTLVGGHDTIRQREPRSRLRPFTSMAAEAVEQDDRGSWATEVDTGKLNALACPIVPLGIGAQCACSGSFPTSVLSRVGFRHKSNFGSA